MYWFVLGMIIGRGGDMENFAIHVFCGLVVVQFFIETFNAGTRSIVQQQGAGAEDGDAAGDVPGGLDAGLALPHRARSW